MAIQLVIATAGFLQNCLHRTTGVHIVITIRPNLPTIAAKIMARDLSSSELLDLDAAFWRDGAGGLHPLPDSRGRNPQRFSHAVDVAEEMDSFMDVHESSIKHCFTQIQGIDQGNAFYDYQVMLDNHKTWLANQIVTAINESQLSKRAVGIACGISEKSAGQTVQGWIKTGTIGKDRLAILAKVTDKPIEFFLHGASVPTKVDGIAKIVVHTLDRLLAMNALNDAALNGLLAHLKSYDPSAINDQSIVEEHKGPRPTGPDLTPDGKPIMGNSDETESKFDALIAAQNARTNKKTG
jgi:hypothetical protein